MLYTISDVHRGFAGRPILRGVNLDIREGEFLTLFGVSGSGKSLLFRILLGLLPADQGRLIFDGQDLSAGNERDWLTARRQLGMLFQESALFDSLSIFDNVAYGLREQAVLPESEIPRRVAESLAAVALPGVDDRFPKELSGGMQKRAALARAIAMRPKLLFYDEPTEGLDPINVTRVNRLLLRLRDRFHMTTVVVTHNMGSAVATSDRLAFLHQGQIAFEGSIADFNARADDPLLKDFVAASKLNLRSGRSLIPPPP